MPAVIDQLALAYEASTAALEDGFDVRVLITAGVLVDFMAVYVTLASDGDVEIIYPLPRAPGMGRSDAPFGAVEARVSGCRSAPLLCVPPG